MIALDLPEAAWRSVAEWWEDSARPERSLSPSYLWCGEANARRVADARMGSVWLTDDPRPFLVVGNASPLAVYDVDVK